MSRAAALLVLALLAGCSTYDPTLLPEVNELPGVPPIQKHRLVVLVPDDRGRAALEEDARRGPMRLDPRALQQELAGALRAVAPAPDRVLVAASEDEALAALDRGYDVLLRTQVARWDASFLGTNGWWYPNAFFLAWYFFPIGPQWLLADELFGVEVELVVTAELASSGRPVPALRERRVVLTSPAEPPADAERAPAHERPPPAFALTDVQRGIDLLGTYFPGQLDADQWEAVGELLGPFAERHAALRTAAAVADGLQRFDALPDEERRRAAASVHALLLGVEDLGPGRPRVAGAAADAAHLGEALGRAGAPPRNVRALVNARAARAEVEAELERLAGRCGRDDALVVAFAGAGRRVQDEAGALGSYALVLPDGGELRLDVLLAALQRVGAFRRVLLLDADFEAGPRGLTLEGLPRPSRPLAQALAAALAPEDVVVLASSGDADAAQSVDDGQGLNGLLTRYAASALAGDADTGQDGLTVGDLRAWLDLHVPHVALTLPRPQRPVVVVAGAFEERAGELLRR